MLFWAMMILRYIDLDFGRYMVDVAIRSLPCKDLSNKFKLYMLFFLILNSTLMICNG